MIYDVTSEADLYKLEEEAVVKAQADGDEDAED
jgi:hypothetical protein